MEMRVAMEVRRVADRNEGSPTGEGDTAGEPAPATDEERIS
jgi:hypothetical protein